MLKFIFNIRRYRAGKPFLSIPSFMSTFFIMKLGQFVLLPFLAIYLNQFSLSSLFLGIIIASGQLSYSIMSLFTGQFIDRYNPKIILSMTLMGSGIAYLYLYQNQSLICFIILNVIIGIFRAIFDVAFKTLLTSEANEQQRSFLFSLRYAILNLAAAVGPLIGAQYIGEHFIQLFKLIAYSYLTSSLLLIIFCSTEIDKSIRKKHHFSVGELFKLIKYNSKIRTLFFISFLCYALYSQITSSIAQYIVQNFEYGISIYSNLLIINAITCVVLQMFISLLTKKMNYLHLASIGLFLFSLGFLGFYFSQTSITLSCSMFILSLGEIIFFPLNDMILAKIAPLENIGSYYGVLNTSTLGLAVGPIVGGLIYQINNHFLFFICAMSSLLTIFLYRKLVS